MLAKCKVGSLERLKLKARFGDLVEAFSVSEDLSVLILRAEDGTRFVTKFTDAGKAHYRDLSEQELSSFAEMIARYREEKGAVVN